MPLNDKRLDKRFTSNQCTSQRPGKCAAIAVRVVFIVIFIINVQCALSFIINPDAFMFAYELSGVSGRAAVQGMGVAFLMWNVTYPLFIVQPCRFYALGWIIIVQQVVGLVGESFILFTLPAEHVLLSASIKRFIVFDAGGLVCMLFALCLFGAMYRRRQKQSR